MARIQFSREQLLGLFNPDYPIPDDMNRSPAIFIAKALEPRLLSSELGEYHPQGRQSKRKQPLKKDITTPKAPAPAPAKPIVPKPSQPVSTPLAWFYLDPTGKIQGPFLSTQLKTWWDQNMLPENLKISASGAEGTFKELKEYFPNKELTFTYNPMVFPFYGKDNFDENDPLQVMFQQYKNRISSQ